MTTASIWVMSGHGLPCGARELSDQALGPATDGRVWLDVCILGQHLPQMYRKDEALDLQADDCARLGLCSECLGFGDISQAPVTDPLTAARGIDEVKRPCHNCGGSGRPAIRVTVRRDLSGGVTGAIRPVPHAYVTPDGLEDLEKLAAFGVVPGACLACGMPEDGKGPRDEALHP